VNSEYAAELRVNPDVQALFEQHGRKEFFTIVDVPDDVAWDVRLNVHNSIEMIVERHRIWTA